MEKLRAGVARIIYTAAAATLSSLSNTLGEFNSKAHHLND